MAATATTTKRTRTRSVPAQTPPPEAVQQPEVVLPDPEPQPPESEGEMVRYVDGLRVIRDEAMPSPLPTLPGQEIRYRSFRLLTLEDGTRRIGCAMCDYAAERKGMVQKHRYDDHGVVVRRSRKAEDGSDFALSADLASMTLADFQELVNDASMWEARFAELEREKEALRERAERDRESWRERAERDRDSWRERALRAEAWQRRTITKLGQMGFTLKAEDES